MLAAVVEQVLADLPPDRVPAEQSDRVEALDLDDPEAAAAFDPEKFARDFAQAPG